MCRCESVFSQQTSGSHRETETERFWAVMRHVHLPSKYAAAASTFEKDTENNPFQQLSSPILGVFKLLDVWLFSGLTSKMPPLGSMLKL